MVESKSPPSPVAGRVRKLAGLSVEEFGESDDRAPLVLLHGLTFDHTMWLPALAELDRIDPGRKALAFDLPGHGASDSWAAYELQSVVEAVHRGVGEAGLGAPVLVGHSMSAIVASIYATEFPARGVVNVDQPLTGEFAGFLQSISDQLRSPAFPSMWEQFFASMHPELLPEDAQALVRSTTTPRQELVLGYWREVLDNPAAETEERVTEGIAALRASGIAYLIVAGSEPESEYRRWLTEVLPDAEVIVLPDSGHFPHLAHPVRFAQCLSETANWGTT
ncbi:MAG TPA: alpha/beta hydrolase [Candidatus Dormibacteraeota bacterium]|jgi:pimeloyl-ACP methyl ester carboxylesterase